MREILRLCIELDTIARQAYAEMAEACLDDSDLHEVFEAMSAEEEEHVRWWTDLSLAWEAGLVPDIVDEHDALERLYEMRAEVERAIPQRFEGISVTEMLDLAGRMEFFMLDPIFGELTDLMQPGSRTELREAYLRHVLRIIDAIERRHTDEGLAAFLARVLRRAFRDQQRLAALAMLDQLTGQYNRRGFLNHLDQWLSWSRRYGRPLALLLIDIDHFKRVNDTLGHPAGDDALVGVSKVLASTIRGSDVIGRFGGDEFVVLAPETDYTQLADLMQRIADGIRGNPLVAGGEPILLSVSVGGAFAPGGVDVSAESLIAAADTSLYEAKAAGRSRAGEPVRAGSFPVA